MQAYLEKISAVVDSVEKELDALSDAIHGFAELGFEEYQSAALLCGYLEKNGFAVTREYGGLPTAFLGRYVAKGGKAAGGLNVGLLCEYDALKGQGHGCAHHMQGPAIIGAAMALRHALGDELPYEISVIGTPAEETLGGGKPIMDEHGAFDAIDFAIMVHGGDCTQIDTPSLALMEFDVEFFGTPAHAGIAPEVGRSAVDAVTMLQTGLALLRGHVKDGVRMNNIVLNGGSAVNIITEYTKVKVELRSTSIQYLDALYDRALKVVDAAALATETTCQVKRVTRLPNTVINWPLADVAIACAKELGCDDVRAPRENPGSTDYGVVTGKVPSCCLRVKTITEPIPPHTDEWVKAGTQAQNYRGVHDGAKAVAAAAYRVLTEPGIFEAMQKALVEEHA